MSWGLGLVVGIVLVLAQLATVAFYLRKHDRLELNSKAVSEESAKEKGSE